MQFQVSFFIEDPQTGDHLVNGTAYLPVPAGSNLAGVPWTTVAAQYQRFRNAKMSGDTSARVPVTNAIQNALDNGTLLEWWFEVRIPAEVTEPAQILQLLKDGITEQEAEMVARLGGELAYWGYRDET